MRLTESDHAFFALMADAIGQFKSHDMPAANCCGCIVRQKKTRNGRRVVGFSFAVKPGRVLEIDIDPEGLRASPKEYIEEILDMVAASCAEAARRFDSMIFIPPRATIAAVSRSRH